MTSDTPSDPIAHPLQSPRQPLPLGDGAIRALGLEYSTDPDEYGDVSFTWAGFVEAVRLCLRAAAPLDHAQAELPPLPKSSNERVPGFDAFGHLWNPLFTESQMRDYARAALRPSLPDAPEGDKS